MCYSNKWTQGSNHKLSAFLDWHMIVYFYAVLSSCSYYHFVQLVSGPCEKYQVIICPFSFAKPQITSTCISKCFTQSKGKPSDSCKATWANSKLEKLLVCKATLVRLELDRATFGFDLLGWKEKIQVLCISCLTFKLKLTWVLYFKEAWPW